MLESIMLKATLIFILIMLAVLGAEGAICLWKAFKDRHDVEVPETTGMVFIGIVAIGISFFGIFGICSVLISGIGLK